MRKLALKSLLFSVLVLFVLSFCSDRFVFKPQPFEETLRQYNNSNKDSIDVFVFGSSHAFNTFNPRMIDSVFNTLTFNMGSGGQKLTVTNYLFEELLKETNPKLVILEVFPSSTRLPKQAHEKGLQLKVFDAMPFSFSKIRKINEIYDLGEMPSVMSRVIRNHNEWYKLGGNSEKVIRFENHRGFIALNGKLKEKDLSEFNNFNSLEFDYGSKDQNELTKIQQEGMLKFIEIAERRNIDILIVSSPFLKARYNNMYSGFETSIKNLTNSKGIRYLSFNKEFYSTGLSLNDFRDPGHLNNGGSVKVTSKLIEYLAINDYLKPSNNNLFETVISNIKPIDKSSLKEKIKEENIDLANQILIKGNMLYKDFSFIESIKCRNIFIDEIEENKYILMEMSSVFDKSELENYEFGFQFIFHEKDYSKRPERIKKLDGDRIATSSSCELINIENKKYLFFKLKNLQLSEYKKIRVFLKNPGKYKKRYGKVLETLNIKF